MSGDTETLLEAQLARQVGSKQMSFKCRLQEERLLQIDWFTHNLLLIPIVCFNIVIKRVFVTMSAMGQILASVPHNVLEFEARFRASHGFQDHSTFPHVHQLPQLIQSQHIPCPKKG